VITPFMISPVSICLAAPQEPVGLSLKMTIFAKFQGQLTIRRKIYGLRIEIWKPPLKNSVKSDRLLDADSGSHFEADSQELSNFMSPPAQPGGYSKEIIAAASRNNRSAVSKS
jgi:hypothetical protein